MAMDVDKRRIQQKLDSNRASGQEHYWDEESPQILANPGGKPKDAWNTGRLKWLTAVIIPLLAIFVPIWDIKQNEAKIVNWALHIAFGDDVDIRNFFRGEAPNNTGQGSSDNEPDPGVLSGVQQDDDESVSNQEMESDFEVAITEDFEKAGAFAENSWYLDLSPDCEARAGTGTLIFANEPSSEELYCNLALAEDSLPWPQVGTIEMRLKVVSHNDEEMNHGIGLYSSEITGEWFVTCGANVEEGVAEASFTGKKTENGLPSTFYDDRLDTAAASTYILELDQWYEFRLEIDYDAETIRCFVDGNLLGELRAEEVPGLLDARIDRSVNSFRSPGATGVTELDEVRILE